MSLKNATVLGAVPVRPTVENLLPKLTKKTLLPGTVRTKKPEKEAKRMLLTTNS